MDSSELYKGMKFNLLMLFIFSTSKSIIRVEDTIEELSDIASMS